MSGGINWCCSRSKLLYNDTSLLWLEVENKSGKKGSVKVVFFIISSKINTKALFT